MKLSDLKTGMIVTRSDGIEMVVYRNSVSKYQEDEDKDCIVNYSQKVWESLSNYNEDMSSKSYERADIVKVELLPHPYAFVEPSYRRYERKTIWESNVKRVTIADIEKMYGCKVKIVDRKE